MLKAWKEKPSSHISACEVHYMCVCLKACFIRRISVEYRRANNYPSHIAEGTNTIVKTMVNWNKRAKQSNTKDKLWSLFFFCAGPSLER